MATPGELVNCIATCFGLSEKTAMQKDRLLAETGLRRSGGRGRNAAKMRAKDAAAELIAQVLPVPIRETEVATRAFIAAPLKDTMPKDETLPFPSFQALGDSHTFGDGLAALLVAASNGEISDFLDKATDAREDPRIPMIWHLEVNLFWPGTAARISFFTGQSNVTLHYNDHPTDMDQFRKWNQKLEEEAPDRTLICGFTQRTIKSVGSIIELEAE